MNTRYGYGVINARSEKAVIGAPPAAGSAPVEWHVAGATLAYPQALAVMEARAAAVAAGAAPELVWLVEHPPLYTAGTSACDDDLIDPRFPLFHVGRGGQLTYHGPGQRVVYLMLDLRRRRPDVRCFVATLEEWIIRALARFDIHGERRAGRIGVWVRRPDKGEDHEDKIAALGIRLKRWVTLHGISINVAPDLAHFSGIVPCGITDPRFGVTSLADLGHSVPMTAVDAALNAEFEGLFGPAERRAGNPREIGVIAEAGECTVGV